MKQEVARKAAIAAFDNAQALLGDAELLLTNGRAPRALGLGRLGREEYAKGFLWAVASLNLVPELLGRLLSSDRATRDHRFRESLASMAGSIHHIINGEQPSAEHRLDPNSEVAWCVRVLTRLGAWVQESGVASGFKGLKDSQKEEDEQRRELYAGLPEAMVSWDLPTREDAFYVDVDEEMTVRTPLGLRTGAAKVVVVDLRVSLRDAEPAIRALNDGALWSDVRDALQT